MEYKKGLVYKWYICETCGKKFEEYYFKRFCCNKCRILFKYGDLIGKKFNRLTVKELITSNGRRRWLCECECGKTITAITSQLINGKTKSCGCYLKEIVSKLHRLPYKEASLNGLYSSYKKSAKEKGLIFEIDKSFFKEITSKNCYYCGIKPSREFKRRQTNGFYMYNGLDRVDNNLGYIKSNVVPCCSMCNIMKKAYKQEDFLSHIKSIYENVFLNKS